MLKQFKIITLAQTCFGSRRNHHQGAVLCLAKTTKYGFLCSSGIDAVNVMAAYQPVVQACGELLPDDGSCMNRNMSEQVL
jgi:hypothetical protein